MEQLDRRDLFTVLSALGAFGALAGAARAQQSTTAQLSVSKVLSYDALPVTKLPNGGEMRHVLSGTLPTGEFVEIHETVLSAGKMPHPPHKHPNSEVLFILSGKLEYVDVDQPIRVGPGDVVFSASNVIHGLSNIGDTPATYIVVSVGKQVKEA